MTKALQTMYGSNAKFKMEEQRSAVLSTYHYNPLSEPFIISIIWSLWSLQMCGTFRSDQMAISESPCVYRGLHVRWILISNFGISPMAPRCVHLRCFLIYWPPPRRLDFIHVMLSLTELLYWYHPQPHS